MSDMPRYQHKGQYTAHFTGAEYACHCDMCRHSIGAGIPVLLVDIAERARVHFGVPIHVNSGYRCPFHNRAIDGAENSYHMCCAQDLGCPDSVPYDEFYSFFEAIPEIHGLGKYPPHGVRKGFVHMDLRFIPEGKERVTWEG